MNKFLNKNIDGIGSALSFVCLIHCLVLPVLLATVPFISFVSFLNSFWAEALMMILAILNAIIAVTSGFKSHKNMIVLACFFSGIVFLMLSFVAHKFLHINDFFTPIGAFVLGTGHILNKLSCKRCHSCQIKNEQNN